ncbi:hypothetical protein H2199_003585 [Coniosporium tulheliwenetii]|uniref:Uncharacterized protein n=1 Tax=Coniosporium tulheliwenetii TaxID=3383036 RepID=A0ACC2ZA42_9PEZI|nr:hypothetical protein H2199_003585 [Cladosporium sp. JES 115]
MVQPSVSDLVRSVAHKLPPIDDPEFGSHFDQYGQSRVVLIGDASHGTSEFYRARAAITQRLIEQHNFNIVAIEGDWPDARAIDRYVRYDPSTSSTSKIPVFKHFPQWMWRNTEVQGFVDWLRKHNAQLSLGQRTMFIGLDLYSMSTSIKAVIEYLDKVDPEIAAVARKRYGCLTPWAEDPAQYGRMAMSKGYGPCEAGVMAMLRDLMQKRADYAQAGNDGDGFLDAEMNARVVVDSEKYYRAMYYGDSQSWNLRDTHMFQTLARLMKLKPVSKAVIWAHNSHLGDARATAMGENRGEINLGQLCREHFTNPGEVIIIGTGTDGGPDCTVAAADEWDEPMKVMKVNPSREDSYERVMHNTGIPSFVLDLREGYQDAEVLKALAQPRLERFIGVIYRPDTERWSHYMKACLTKQFDAFVWFDKSTAVHAFETAQPKEAPSKGETYPFGL